MALKQVGIIGSGTMGTGIAEAAALTGHEVILRSRAQSSADGLLAALDKSLARQVEKGKLTGDDRDAAAARVRATTDLHELATCDLVIESIVEDLETKRRLFDELDHVCQRSAVLATNTSTLPVVEMAMATGRPDQVCGIHFFNPAPALALVEIVKPITASSETIEIAQEFALACGKTPIVVADTPGFIVNALLFPYMNNAVRLLEQQVASAEDIDEAMKLGAGFPMGPFALFDLVGLDVSLAILDALHDAYKEPSYAARPMLRRMVSAGRLGRKTGAGFFEYKK